ncbi:MAG: peptidylprolyl isomerase [Pseudomonadota bacterium]
MPHRRVLIFITICLLLPSLAACNPGGEKPAASKSDAQVAAPQPPPVQQPLPQSSTLPDAVIPANLVVDVNGHKMTQEQLNTELGKRLLAMKDQIPQNRLQEAKESIKKRLVDDFIIHNLLMDEVNRQKITATDKDVGEAVDQLKSTLPSGVTIDELMKKNQVTSEQMNEEIRFGIRINKLVLASMGGKTKPTDKEITAFYQKNKDKFKLPESVHVRHILVAKAAGDDEKTKAEKKAKADDLRKQLLDGADFAKTAHTLSDCPSKQAGGDLGAFTRGQMVKPFEDAAFSQKKGEIGPVVETDFGYHIIQVLEKNSSKTMNLDGEAKEKITEFLTQQKQQQAFERIIKELRDKAKIVYHGQ